MPHTRRTRIAMLNSMAAGGMIYCYSESGVVGLYVRHGEARMACDIKGK